MLPVSLVSRRCARDEGLRLAFLDRNCPIDSKVGDSRSPAARPADLELIHLLSRPKPEVETQIRVRGVAASTNHIASLSLTAGCNKRGGSNRIAGALLCSNQLGLRSYHQKVCK